MERDEGIEPSPRPWQGRVLPLYESRENEFIFIACGRTRKQASQAKRFRRLPGIRTRPRCFHVHSSKKWKSRRLVDFLDAGGLHDRRAALALGKPCSPF